MRVIHIFKDYYPPTTGGIEQHMNLLCRGLARTIDVTVMVPSRSRRKIEEYINGVQVIRLPEFGRYPSAPLCPTMPFELRRLRPNLVHLHFPNPTGDFAYLLSGCRAPALMTYHADVVKQRFQLWLYRPIFKNFLYRRIRRIIVASQDYLSSSPFISRYPEKCVVIPYGVDLETLSLRDGEGIAVERLRWEHAGRLVLFVGVLRYYKGLDVLLRAMTKVEGHLLIVGRGPEQEVLKTLASQLGLDTRVRFLGEVSERERRVLLHAADVFVLPSIDRCEAFGIAQLEAMACAKPVVSSDLPTGVRFVNLDGVSGLLVPPGDPDALAETINRLLNDVELRARLGKAARERVEQQFTAERMIAQTLEVYNEVLRSTN